MSRYVIEKEKLVQNIEILKQRQKYKLSASLKETVTVWELKNSQPYSKKTELKLSQ